MEHNLLVCVVIQVIGWRMIHNGWGDHHLLCCGLGWGRQGDVLTGIQLVLVRLGRGGF